MHHRTGATKSASTGQSSEEKEPVQEGPPNTGRVPTHLVKRRGELSELGGRKTIEPETIEPETIEPQALEP